MSDSCWARRLGKRQDIFILIEVIKKCIKYNKNEIEKLQIYATISYFNILTHLKHLLINLIIKQVNNGNEFIDNCNFQLIYIATYLAIGNKFSIQNQFTYLQCKINTSYSYLISGIHDRVYI